MKKYHNKIKNYFTVKAAGFLFIMPLFILSTGIAGQSLNDRMSKSVVTVTVAAQNYDYYSPWEKKEVQKQTTGGVILEGNLILTSSYMLANHVLVEVSKNGNERKYPAEVLLKDYYCGLALIRVPDKTFYEGMLPVKIGGAMAEGGEASVIKWDDKGTLKTYSARLLKTSIQYYQNFCGVLFYSMIMDEVPGGSGDPLIADGSLAGITVWYNSREKMAEVLAVDVIKRMLADFSDGAYEGVPFFYIEYDLLDGDENLREYLGLGPNDTGIIIDKVAPASSGSGVLKKNDVILSVNGIDINDKGMYRSATYGELRFHGIIYLNQLAGQDVKMEIIRDKKKKSVSFKLLPVSKDTFLIPGAEFDVKPAYYIFGGIVLQELSKDYLTTWGEKWAKKANKRLLYYYENQALAVTPDRRRIIILNKVLPASINSGYHDYGNVILETVNDQKIRDLAHCRSIIGNSKEKFIKFTFSGGQRIIIDAEKTRKDEANILKRYNIQSPFNME